MKLTVYHDGQFWVGVAEERDHQHLKAGRFIFGTEPKDSEILSFVHDQLLPLMEGIKESIEIDYVEKRVNPKRLARLVAKEMKHKGISSYAHQAIQQELQNRKQERREQKREQKKELDEWKWIQSRQKKKEKRKGK